MLRKRSKVIVFITLLHLSAYGLLHAQSPYVPAIVPPSPNAASLVKFADVPVNTYSGTADFSIPIYTIQGKGISVPVSLSYHTGGVRLKEEAGWVGLGWALNAGGVISRTILDKEDFGTTGAYFTSAVPQLPGDLNVTQHSGLKSPVNLGNYTYDFFCNYDVNTTSGTANYFNAFSNFNPPYDLEPDLYSFNFMGRSGKFMITRDRKVILQKQENLNIKFDTNGLWFIITDEQGNRFVFDTIEYTESATGAASTLAVSSWYLSAIISQQNETINFSYYNDNTWTAVGGNIYDTYSAYCAGSTGFFRGNDAGTWYTNKTLQTVDFPNGQLQFIFDNKRSDLREGRKLNAVKIYAKKPSGLDYLKEYDLYYSYFNSIVTNSDTLEFRRLRLDSVKENSIGKSVPAHSFVYNDPNSNLSFYAKHGFGVDHWGFCNGASNTTFIPTIYCYYNPPGAGGGNPGSDYFGYNGANREADPAGIWTQAFSLQQIKYPEGGKTVLGYEPNEYDRQRSINGPVDFPYVAVSSQQLAAISSTRGTTTGTYSTLHITPTVAAGSGFSNAQLTIVFRGGASNYRNTFGKIYFKLTGPSMNFTEDISTGDLNCSGGYVCSVTLPLTLQASTYTWTIYIDPTIGVDFQDVRGTLYFNEEQSYYNSITNNVSALPGGGLRIKSITDYSRDNIIAKKRVYDYSYFQDYDGNGIPERNSYGRLMSMPSYVRYVTVPSGAGGFCNNLTLSGGSISALSSLVQGNAVGYDQVTEYTVDPSTGIDNGKTIYYYTNSPDTSFDYKGFRMPGCNSMPNNLDGLLYNKAVYSNSAGVYKKVSETYNYFRTANRIVYYSMKYQHPPVIGTPSTSSCTADTAVDNEILTTFYPSIKSERVLLDSTKNITYDQADVNKTLINVTKNYYDNTLHYQLSRTKTTDSKGNTIVSMMKYPQDYIPSGFPTIGNTILDSMIQRNMVGVVIEKRDSLYQGASGYTTAAQLNYYKFLSGNALGLDKQYQLDIPSPVTDFQAFSVTNNVTNQDSRYRQMISFDTYNNSNDITQYTSTDGLPVSVIWDYFKTYPIAKVNNALSAKTAYTSFEADGNGNWTVPDTIRSYTNFITGRKSYSLVTGKTISAAVSSGSQFIVSYWSRNGALTVKANTVSMPVTFTGVVKNGWTYYEHLLPNTTTAIAITATSAILDELRLYPLGAHMASYTFNNLYGISSTCDDTNHISTYEYDALGRLLRIKDFDGNIIKTFEYYYKNQILN